MWSIIIQLSHTLVNSRVIECYTWCTIKWPLLCNLLEGDEAEKSYLINLYDFDKYIKASSLVLHANHGTKL